MTARIFLNELKTDERQLAQPEAGKWKTDNDFLGKFANDIHVKGQVRDGIINSVPSVFARPIQFYQALEDEKHPMHKTVRDQWRGLLAVFALRKALNLSVRTVLYTVRDEKDVEAGDQDLRFTHILRTQMPHPAEEWKSWLMLYCDDQLVGATSPWTIVYTPSSYKLERGVPWVDDRGLLTDPFQTLYDAGGNNYELSLLHAWLQQVIGRHPWSMLEEHHERAKGALHRELTAWRGELVKAKVPRADVTSLVESVKAPPPFVHFLSAIDAESVPDSDFVLDDGKPGESVLVLSRTAFENPQLRKKRVYGSVRVEDLDLAGIPGPQGTSTRSRTGALIGKPYVVAEEYFLSDRLFRIPLSPDAAAAGTRDYALPLKPAFFKHFGPEKIDDRMLTIDVSPDAVGVRLRLPLSNGTTLDVERRYRAADQIDSITEGVAIPVMAFWPDFYDPQWNDYEAIVVAEPRPKNLILAPIYSDGTTDAAVSVASAETIISIWRSDKPVLGFALQVEGSSRRRTDAGVLVRKRMAAPKKTGEKWHVGVDFGTSNTQIMVRRNDGTREPLPLEGRTVLLSTAIGLNVALLQNSLHHEGKVSPPFPTLLRKETVTLVSKGTAAEETIGVVSPRVDVFALAQDSSSYVRDLKWTADENTQKLYLDKIARLVVAEARAAGVEELQFEWSFPLALPARIRSTMEQFWAAVGNDRTRPGLAVASSLGTTESEAVSRCVTARKLLPLLADNLSISVDVGGGSTDVAFWTGNTLIDRLSLNIAGNDVIRVASVFDELNEALRVSAQVSAPFVEAFEKRPEIMWNALLALTADRQSSPHEHRFIGRIVKSTHSDTWRKARTGAYLALGGVFYYLGIHAANYYKAASSGVSIYLGGRGSALLSWLAPPARVKEILQRHFLAGLEVGREGAKVDTFGIEGPVVGTKSVKIVLKDEVASGLLEHDVLHASVDGLNMDSTTAGEINWTDAHGEEVKWTDALSSEKLAGLKPPANHNSSFIAHFLRQMARQSAETLDLDAEGLTNLQLTQNWTIHDMRMRTQSADYALQPIFAYELKSLVRQYGENAATAS